MFYDSSLPGFLQKLILLEFEYKKPDKPIPALNVIFQFR